MIRMVYCITRHPDVEPAEFRRFWEGEHASLVAQVAEALGAKRHAQALTLDVARNRRIMELRGTGEPFDGIVEFWFDNARELEAMLDSDQRPAVLEQMVETDRRYFDFAASRAFFTEEPRTPGQ